MSSTNSNDRLTLLSYATFNHHIPIHDHSWAAPVKTGRDDGSFSIISLTECQEALSEGQFGKQTRDTYFVWSRHSRTKCWYWSLHVLGTLPFFFWIFPQKMKLNHSVHNGSDGGSLWRLLCSLVHPKTQGRNHHRHWGGQVPPNN